MNTLYVAAYDDSALAILSRNATSGKLGFLRAVKGSDFNADMRGVRAVAVSPDDAHLYLAARDSNTIVVLSIGPN